MPSCFNSLNEPLGLELPRFTGGWFFSFLLCRSSKSRTWLVAEWDIGLIWVVFESVPERSLSGRWGTLVAVSAQASISA